MEKYRDREISKLSGGQRQRVWIAMALAQNTKILFLDEPTTYLDIRYQLEILQLVRKLNEQYGLTIIMVLHDINQAIHYSDRIIGLKDGKVGKCYSHIYPNHIAHNKSSPILRGIWPASGGPALLLFIKRLTAADESLAEWGPLLRRTR